MRGDAPIAARSLKFTAAARWPIAAGGVASTSQSTPATTESTVATTGPSGCHTTASSPLATGRSVRGASKIARSAQITSSSPYALTFM